MDLKKKEDRTPLLTTRGKFVFYPALINGLLWYLVRSLRLLGDFPEKINDFLDWNSHVFTFLMIFFVSIILTNIVTNDSFKLINKK